MSANCMKEVVINGVTYVQKQQPVGKMKIVVLDRGYVYIGIPEKTPDEIIIHNARCLIRWGTTNHLGELVSGPKPNTKLGVSCTVRAPISSIQHMIDVEDDKWMQ